MNRLSLIRASLSRAQTRTVGLVALVALLALLLMGGALLATSLQNGLGSLEARLGADIMVAPKTARSAYDLESILVDGTPGHFYMPASLVQKVAEREGVEIVSAQYYLATAKASCCALPVQIIGFDPATDFTIQPWIARSVSSELGREDVVVGSKISGAVGNNIVLYGVQCRIVGKLDETGTQLDQAIYATGETVRDLIDGSARQGLSVLTEYNPDQVVSTVQVKVAQGYSIENVTNDINLHVRDVWATSTKALTSGVADSISGVSRLVGVLVAVVWLLAVALLMLVFLLVGKFRTHEFAIMRTVGATKKQVTGVLMGESVVIGVLGALVGIAIAVFVVLLFNTQLESVLNLPFLLPGAPTFALLGLGVLAATLAAVCVAAALSASRLCKVDPVVAMRQA